MKNVNLFIRGLLALALLAAVAAHADPGDDAAVAKARKDYETAMKGNDVGQQNVARIQLGVQLQLAKARTEKKEASGGDARASGKKSD